SLPNSRCQFRWSKSPTAKPWRGTSQKRSSFPASVRQFHRRAPCRRCRALSPRRSNRLRRPCHLPYRTVASFSRSLQRRAAVQEKKRRGSDRVVAGRNSLGSRGGTVLILQELSHLG